MSSILQVRYCLTNQLSLEIQTVLTDNDKYAFSMVATTADVATASQFQASSLYNNEVLTPAGARNSSADVAELVDAHV